MKGRTACAGGASCLLTATASAWTDCTRRSLAATTKLSPDTQSLRTWDDLGVPVELTTTDNWWSNGPTGPCGPDSEIFVWTGDVPPQGTPGTDGRWMELWNHVTLRYQRFADGSLQPPPQPSV